MSIYPHLEVQSLKVVLNTIQLHLSPDLSFKQCPLLVCTIARSVKQKLALVPCVIKDG